MNVVIDIFSGRPNPSFDIVGPESETVAQLLADTAESSPVELGAPPDGLGFRGFLLESPAYDEQFVVTETGVWRSGGTSHRDAGNRLYAFLRELAIRDHPDLVERLPSSQG